MRVVIVGAGMAGLTCARQLVDRGHDVVVLERGSSPGGRLATRRIGAATLDTGAQFFTTRSDEFAAAVTTWQTEGVVNEWCRGFGEPPDGYPRYCATRGMGALAEHLAIGLDVRCDELVFAVFERPAGWTVRLDDGSELAADAVVVTCPLPQALSVSITADTEWPTDLQYDYQPTLALLVVLDGPSAVPPPGGVQDADDTFSFVADNAAKGISRVPALTLHASATWSAARFGDDAEAVRADLLAAASPWIGDTHVVASQLKKWRFAAPTKVWPERFVVLGVRPGPLVLAGDAYGGPRVEGAYLSGLAAADTVRADT